MRLGSIGAQLGELVNEFSSDNTLSGNSNQAVPTEAAVRNYFPQVATNIIPTNDNSLDLGSPSKRWAHVYGSVLQGELRDDKGKAFSPTISETELRSLGLPASMPTTSSGLRILGAPVGTIDFYRSFASEKIHEISKDFDTLGRMPSHQAQLLVATKAVVHRINHLLRNIPGGELSLFGEMAATYDSSVISVARRIAASPSLPDVSQRICQLSPRKGGLGLRTWGSTADNAFLAAYTHASHSFPILFPDRPYLSNMTPDEPSLQLAPSIFLSPRLYGLVGRREHWRDRTQKPRVFWRHLLRHLAQHPALSNIYSPP